MRLAEEKELACLPEVERAAARRFLPYTDKLGISAELLEGLTPLSYLKKAQAEGRVWVAIAPKSQQPSQQLSRPSSQQQDAQPVGFLVAKFLATTCFIVEVSVHPDYGRQGIGSALMQACCAATHAKGINQIMLTTFRYVPWNIPFYQKLGFQLLEPEYWPSEVDAIVRHEARYGFAPQHRAVMRRVLTAADSASALRNARFGAETC